MSVKLMVAAAWVALSATSTARADVIAWTRWAAPGSVGTSATGEITGLGSPPVNVTTSTITGGSGIIANPRLPFELPSAYVGGVVSNPPCSDAAGECLATGIEVFSLSGSRSISFSSPVQNPVFAVRVFATSLVLTFPEGTLPAVQMMASGPGGSFEASGAQIVAAFSSQGSFLVPGTYGSLTFTDSASRSGAVGGSLDYFFTVGVPTNTVPEPSCLGLLAAGSGLLALCSRPLGRRRSA